MTKNSKTNSKNSRALSRRANSAARRPSSRAARVPRSSLGRRGPLDAHGLALARLLKDPCHAELAEPIYMSTGTGYLTRCVLDKSFTDDSGVVFVNPASWGLAGANCGLGYATSTGAGNSIGGVAWYNGPGAVFLTSVAAEVRPVAACITTYYAGTESLRAGSVAQAQVDAAQASLVLNSGATPDSLGPFFATEDRTPGTSLETRWAPGAQDGDWGNSTTSYWTGGHGAVGVLWRSLGGQAIKFRVTVVYEWKPTQAEGLQNEPARGSKSANTIDQVVGFLAGQDPMWGLSRPGAAMTSVGGDLIGAMGRLALPVARNFALRAATGLLTL